MTTTHSVRGAWRDPVSERRPVFNVEALGAIRGLSTFSTAAIQEAMEAAADAPYGIVDFPGDRYLIGDQELHFYSDITLQGRGGGGSGSTAGTILYQASGAHKLLAPATPGSVTRNFEARDLAFASTGNASNLGGIDLTNCANFHLRRVTVAGSKVFGIKIAGGTVAGDAGFGSLDNCVIAALDSASVPALLLAGTNADQPDGCDFYNLYIQHNGRWIQFTGAGAGHGPQSMRFHGGSCEGNSGSDIDAVLSDAFGMGADFLGTRFENTGSGGLVFTFYSVGTQCPATFHGGVIALSGGARTWNDNGHIPVQTFGLADAGIAPGGGVVNVTSLATLALAGFALTDGANIATAANRGARYTVTLGGNRTMDAPTSMVPGQRITYVIRQDGTGGRTLAWNAVFHQAWSNTGNTLNKESTISFIWNGTFWAQDGAQSPYV